MERLLQSVSLRGSEWICLAYFAWIALLLFLIPAAARRRRQFLFVNTAIGAGIVSLRAAPSGFRDWIPLLLMLAAYYEGGLLTFPRADQSFEKAFLRWDRIFFGRSPGSEFPGWLEAVFEFFYLQCYSIVPLGIALLWFSHEARFADFYWTNVLGSAFIAYGLTPLFPALPPRKLNNDPPSPDRSPLRRFSVWISDHVGIRVNSFPSGHTAAAVAATLAMLRILPVAGVCYLIVTIGILLGSVRGRYHYAVDAVAGVFVALAVFFAALRI